MRLITFFAMGLFLVAPWVFAEQVVFGAYVVHYSAVNTTAIPETMAKKYQIMQDKHYAMLNVSVFQQVEGQADKSVVANISAKVRDSSGKEQEITLRLLKDEGVEGASYVGIFVFQDKIPLEFVLAVDPNLQGAMHPITFSQTFFSD
ncbi:DUF4426 domain-containing protein [Beggiatoa leptomitoformis]|uniref:DUF4426 domain-containing protein n=1 Tax=Beggiatoa leptomitoformis TaxID=288004 RepID=A0A2N9YIX4_9GAMM|nr:DUF4426 domain-containing protein [Beggiatoa leptomitoformis]AUI70379.1 DUF4426 domain-containing protein [Beggiatoa leptomitoformis]QGX03607.1 DUF4426 domain-containing protein [Beggiatoa leptomitoformis]